MRKKLQKLRTGKPDTGTRHPDTGCRSRCQTAEKGRANNDTGRTGADAHPDRSGEQAQAEGVEGERWQSCMTGHEMIDYIQSLGLEGWEIEMKVNGTVCDVVDAARYEGKIRLYPDETEE